MFGQLLVGTFSVQCLLLFSFVTYIVVSQRNVAEQRTRDRTAQQLERLAAACAKPLSSGDTQSLHNVLELSRVAPTIDVARVTDLHGNTLAVTDNGQTRGLDTDERRVVAEPLRQQVFKLGNGQLEAVTPIPSSGPPAALLWLEPNHALSLNTARVVLRICLTYGLFALLANIVPLFLIVRTMTRPLSRLRRATQRVVEHEDLHREFPLPVTKGNEAGDLTESFNTMVDELTKQRAGLLETVALLDSMLGNAPTGFAFFDRDLRYVKLNAYLAAMLGSTVDHQVGRRASDAHPGPLAETLEQQLTHVFHTGESVRNVEVIAPSLAAKGDRHWILHFYPVLLGENSVKWAGMIAADITERLQAEEVLRRTEKLAAAGRLAASVAHEINNPLEAVTNLLYLLSTHNSLDETATQFVASAQAELARVSEITQQTLRFYRQSTSPGRTDIAEVLGSVLALYQPRITSARVQVVRKFLPGAHTFAFSGELRQVFANLIGNAVDAMPQGGCLYLRARPGHGKGADGQWRPGVRICVADNGTGMSEETLGRIFEAFFTTKQATGTGLGLWVSYEIVQKHSGTVRVRSRMGAHSGTVFAVFLPKDGLHLRTETANQHSGLAQTAAWA